MIRIIGRSCIQGCKTNVPTVCAFFFALIAFSVSAQESRDALSPALRLGKRLFVENRFTNPSSNFAASCRSCHLPEWAPEGKRAYSDSLQYSLLPTNSRGRKLTTLRNGPSLLDVGGHVRFNHDGRFTSLEDTIQAELESVHLGWLPGQREDVLSEIHTVLLYDTGDDEFAEGTYAEQFKGAYAIDVEAVGSEEAVGWVVKCLAEYVASLKSTRTSAYDAFVEMNPPPQRVPDRPSQEEAKIHNGFSLEAFAGFKIFMGTSGEAKTGNCVACHSPPLFSDGDFHNTGVAQAEYDAAHGAGAFASLSVPNAADTPRPDGRFGPKLVDGIQVNADLGYWNYVEPSEGAATGAFKTPTLRNLKYTDPYMHNGAYPSLEKAIAQKIKACSLAKSGVLRNGDSAMLLMNITEEDVAPLVAFLLTLTDVSTSEYKDYLRSGVALVDFESN